MATWPRIKSSVWWGRVTLGDVRSLGAQADREPLVEQAFVCDPRGAARDAELRARSRQEGRRAPGAILPSSMPFRRAS
jgi:hypothetical protein